MFLFIDKPLGISSFDVIRKLRKILNIKKMGHIGTLDPLATGALLVATENSTKLIPLLEGAKKEYIATIILDGKTASLDLGTPVVWTDMGGYQDKNNESIVSHILSQKTQIPPLYSALHVEGGRAYDLARKGKEFTIEARPIEVYECEILGRTTTSIDIRVVLSSGGYVRSFAPLVGKFLGVEGGYISALRRTKIYTEYGVLDGDDARSFDNPHRFSYSQIFHTIPTFDISDLELEDIKNGKTLSAKTRPRIDEEALVFLKNGEYISLARFGGAVYTIIRNNV